MTTAGNNVAGGRGVGYSYPVSSGGSFDINAGDLVWYDTTAYYLKPADTDAHMAYLVGVAYDSSFLNLYGTKKYETAITVQSVGIGRFKTTSGDTYHHGDACYLGADAQTITNTVGGSSHIVGYISLPGGNTVAGGAGILVEMILAPQYPTAAVAA